MNSSIYVKLNIFLWYWLKIHTGVGCNNILNENKLLFVSSIQDLCFDEKCTLVLVKWVLNQGPGREIQYWITGVFDITSKVHVHFNWYSHRWFSIS